MNEELRKVIEHYTLNAFQVAWISVIVSVITFLITNYIKNYFENRLLLRKLQTEHKFEQRKKIKETLAKYKVHLLTACEDLNHALWNLSNNYAKGWIKVDGSYLEEHYYFHSRVYRILCVFAWIKKINKEMVYFDTTIAAKEDMDFIKFMKVFPNTFCDLVFIIGPNADGDYAIDHFFRTKFELFSDSIISEDGVMSYAEFIQSMPIIQGNLNELLLFIDGVSPDEDRMRWDRLNLIHIGLITFLNCYGYDFQKTSSKKIRIILTKPRVSPYLENYFKLLTEYRLIENKEVKRIHRISKEYYENS